MIPNQKYLNSILFSSIGSLEQSKTPDFSKTLDYKITQLLEKSVLDLDTKEELSREIRGLLSSEGNSQTLLRDLHGRLESKSRMLGNQFLDTLSMAASKGSLNMSNASNMSRITALPATKKYINRQTINDMGYLKNFGSSFNLSGGADLSIVSGTRNTFRLGMPVGGSFNQTSEAFLGHLRFQGSNTHHKLFLFQESAAGFLAGGSIHGNPYGPRSEAIYATGREFITDIGSNKAINPIRGLGDLQRSLLGQMTSYLDNYRTKGGVRSFEEEASRAVGMFNEIMQSQLHYFGEAGDVVHNRQEHFNRFAKMLATQNTTRMVPHFSPNPENFRMGSAVPYEAAYGAGYKSAVSAGQAGRSIQHISGALLNAPSTVSKGLAYQHGYRFDEFREMHKSLGEITPLKGMGLKFRPDQGPGRYGRILSGAFGGSSTGFAPVGLRMQVEFGRGLTDRSINGMNTNLFSPDGAVVVNKNKLLSSNMPLAYQSAESIKLTGPGGSSGGGFVNRQLHSLVQGGDINIGYKGATYSVPIMGLSNSNSDFNKALQIGAIGEEHAAYGVRNELQKVLNSYGLPLSPNTELGLDLMGESVYTSKNSNVSNFVRFASIGDETLDLKLTSITNISERQLAALKIAGGPNTHAKMSFNWMSQDAFDQIAGQASSADALFERNILSNATNRAYYQSGALQYSLRNQKGAGAVLSQMDPGEMLKFLYQNNSEQEALAMLEESLPGVSSYLESNKSVQSQLFGLRNIKGSTVEETLARVGGSLLSNENEVQAMIGNIYSVYNKGNFGEVFGEGKGQRLTSFGSEITHIQEMQLGELEHRAAKGTITKQKIQEELKTLTTALLKKDASEEILNSSQRMQSYVVAGIRDEGNILGMGQRASLEPRMFDIGALNPSLKGGVLPEVTSRMTNYNPSIAGLQKTLEGNTLGAQQVSLSQFKQMKAFERGSALNLGLSGDQIDEVNNILREKTGGKVSFGGEVYLPSELELSSMGKVQMGAGLERSKSAHEIFNSFADDMKQMRGEGFDARKVATRYNAFHNQILGLQRTQIMGQAGGTHGMMRNRVAGSMVAFNMPYSENVGKALGFLEGGVEGVGQDYLDTLRKSFHSNAAKEGIERQVFMGETALSSMFEDAIGTYKKMANNGDTFAQQMVSQYENTLTRLRSGEGVAMIMGRDPAIGAKSLTTARVYMDRVNPSMSSFQGIQTADTRGMLSINGVQKEVQIGALLDLAGDHDGDRFKIFAVGSHNSEQVLTASLQNRQEMLRHSMRYNAIKQNMIDDIGAKASALKTNIPSMADDVTARGIQAARAQGAVKTIVPSISNTFTAMKYATLLDNNLSNSSKQALWDLFEAAEQVPISGKRFVEQTEYGEELLSRLSNVRKNMLGADTSDNAVNELMSLFVGDDRKKMNLSLSYGEEVLNETVDYIQMSDDLKGVLQKFNSNEMNKDVLNILRSKRDLSNISAAEMRTLTQHLSANMQGVHYHMEKTASTLDEMIQVGSSAFRTHSRNQASGYAEAVMNKAANKVQNPMNYKALGAIAAAGVLAMGAASIALNQTFTPVQNKENYVDPDYLFPNEMENINPNLHNSNMPSSGAMITGRGYQGTISLPPGARLPQTLAGRLSGLAQDTTLQMVDHRMSIDAHRIDKINREII